jgi:hypothetical protein
MALRRQLDDFTAEPLDPNLLRFHFAFSRKGLAGIVEVFPNPIAQRILVGIKITDGRGIIDPTLPDQLDRFQPVFAAEYSFLLHVRQIQ